jgi:dihydrofolate synthase/folylpolyglutamate synthase
MFTYDDALDYLYSFVDYSLSRTYKYSAETFDLRRMVDFMHALGDPQKRYPTVHVTGTKGKGSVSAIVASALRAAGYRVGFYTSPHLQDFCERAQVNGELIPRATLIEIVLKMKALVDAGSAPGITTFELSTALAFEYFARVNVDVAVVEVGLGGRLDATNIITPLASVITSLSYDHMNLLGDTLAQIAAEKGGIIKPGVPLITAPHRPEALEVLERMAAERGAAHTLLGRDWFFQPVRHSLDEQSFQIWSAEEQTQLEELRTQGHEADWNPLMLTLPLLGQHQVENGAVAYATLMVLRERGLPVAADAIEAGFRDVRWPGRFEILNRAPFVVADGAHNRDSAQKLTATLREYFPGRRVTLLFGASSDKDVTGMLDELLPAVHRVIFTQAVHPRAQDPEALVPLARQAGLLAKTIPSVGQALTHALQLAARDEVILACGSLFVVAEVRMAWNEKISVADSK